eukprot:CAMPEP_0176435696 /NCGR_PEP_ID=MMETSP0127-20121128/17493_1 /TAXON_ID=938130 /ORGANISM="Platyophrya macrostoma, Strain WH" /LENGTH=446 /DNA_ID=CAMNT_0017818807 /DNA_START=38 /DNA_END=1378 /DNA_ORIENTATION=+
MEPKTTIPKGFEGLKYLNGFGNHFETEAIPDSLPKGQNAPQKCPHGLYAEQLSGTAFTKPRHENLRSWLYRIVPSVKHSPYKPIPKSENYSRIKNDFFNKEDLHITPDQTRWKALPEPKNPTNWVEGLVTVGGAGDPTMKDGLAIYLYAANTSMEKKAFYSSDGDFLIVPQLGDLYITTELGKLEVKPTEIVVIPRGIKFKVDLGGFSRGYVCEIFKGHFVLPDLGPIGANGLANPRDFQTPTAAYEEGQESYTVINKFQGEMFEYEMDHTPFDIVAWHGNYYPFKYDLALFNTINTVSYDHPDPSIFTVLTCQSDEKGSAICDLAIFPPRWMVAEKTFRPPYYHRNAMSEFMGNIKGTYDAKEEGFGPGCSSLHSMMSAHGPEGDVFEKASNAELKPVKLEGNLAFMFESCYQLKTTKYVMTDDLVDKNYWKCWQNIKTHFDAKK